MGCETALCCVSWTAPGAPVSAIRAFVLSVLMLVLVISAQPCLQVSLNTLQAVFDGLGDNSEPALARTAKEGNSQGV